jgi:hypothetical protein
MRQITHPFYIQLYILFTYIISLSKKPSIKAFIQTKAVYLAYFPHISLILT